MRQIKTFSDERLDNYCSYCGEGTETRDHVPSKVLLDKPYPDNLPVVFCCKKCNNNFSLDEEYFACFIECVVSGTTDINKIEREKIKKILIRKPKLLTKIEQAQTIITGQKYFQIDEERFKTVLLKLAKGHAKYENSEPKFEKPNVIWIKPLDLMTEKEVGAFFSIYNSGKTPEIGSRSFQRIFIANGTPIYDHWIIVQEGNYMYSVQIYLDSVIVKLLIRDYLAGEVIWNE